MTREEHTQKIIELSEQYKYLLLRLPTSFGKSRVSIELIRKYASSSLFYNLLIVIPRLVLIDNWKKEIVKWGGLPDNVSVEFTTYISLHKHCDKEWGMIVFDETHHFTENCLDAMDSFNYDRVICMSATIPREQKYRLREAFSGIKEYSVTAREAINEEILPDPKVLFIPLMLDNVHVTQRYVKNKSKPGTPITAYYTQKRSVMGIKNRPVILLCTEQDYYNEISIMIDWWKQKYMSSQEVYAKNNWLRLAKDRLTWLSERKNEFVKDILEQLKDFRVITFCGSIEQTEELGKYCINSKNKSAIKYLDMFNDNEINHITACGMLNEGANLTNCQIGVYANIVSSEIMEIQRLGRNLRHQNPLLIIPYFVGTREEEIVNKMVRNYNEELTTTAFKSQVNLNLINRILYGTTENNN